MLKIAQAIEDLECQRDLLPLKLDAVDILKDDDGILYFEMPRSMIETLNGLQLKGISLNFLYRTVTNLGPLAFNISGRIRDIGHRFVYFQSSFHFRESRLSARNIIFEYNRMSTRASLNALDFITPSMSVYLSEFADAPGGGQQELACNGTKFGDEDFVWFNKQVETNNEQQTAIKNIINGTAYPFPYVVFGPPGEIHSNPPSAAT